jgi:hypothetical protein
MPNFCRRLGGNTLQLFMASVRWCAYVDAAEANRLAAWRDKIPPGEMSLRTDLKSEAQPFPFAATV